MSNRYRGQVDVPAFGEGYYLRLNIADQAALSDKEALGENWFMSSLNLCELIDGGHAGATQDFFALLKHALRDGQGKKLSAEGFDDLIEAADVTPAELADPMQEALCLSVRGQTAEEFMKWMAEQTSKMEKALAEGEKNPTKAARKTS